MTSGHLTFGTDGVRGVANSELTPELALALGRAAARVLGAGRWVVGRDTRLSGPMLTAALAAGLASEGAHVVDVGVLPTPGVAFASARQDVPAAMISASHNPFADNGIKLFAPGGHKLTDADERRVEDELTVLTGLTNDPPITASTSVDRPIGEAVGVPALGDAAADASDRYAEHLTGAVLDGRRLDGLRVVVDCANGAASALAPTVLTSLGAALTVIHAAPDGCNINDGCGSTHPSDLQHAVRERGADVGLAFDGDADRVIAVDATGELVDGDHIIALSAIDLRDRGRLAHDTVVVTVMSNLGFRQGMRGHGIEVVETPVGDRHVLEAMAAGGHALGGEQSGHVIFGELATTGDGLLTGLVVLDLVRRSGRPLAELAAAAMTRLPQVLINVRVPRGDPRILDRLSEHIEAAEAELGDAGRVLVRTSGTEPLVRVMVEAPTEPQARAVAERLADAVERSGTG